MKKMLILSVLVVVMLALFVGTAFAGSWWVVNDNSYGDDGISYWNTNSTGVGNSLTWALDSSDGSSASDRTSRIYYRNNAGTSQTNDRLSINSTDANGGVGNRDTLSAGTPHGGFSTTTGYCKTCHAIHEAGEESYRLLKSGSATDHEVLSSQYSNDAGVVEGANRSSGEGALSVFPAEAAEGMVGNAAENGFGTDRSNECMYCHDADAGFSPMRPYALSILTIVRGEHTVGATHVPDRGDISEMVDRDPFDGDQVADNGTLQCYMCHSVHGSKTIGSKTVGNSKWGDVIVRLDPNNDGTDLAQGLYAGVPVVTAGSVGVANGESGGFETNNNIARTAFCVDCHIGNGNWDTNPADDLVAGAGGFFGTRPNVTSHIQGPADDGTMEVYGTDMKVAWDDYKLDDGELDAATATEGSVEAMSHKSTPKSGCRGCHSAEDHGTEQKDFAGLQSTWPHQTIGPKLLNDALGLMNIYGDGIVRSEENNVGGIKGNDAGVIGDADRQLINMDAVCLRCHRDNKTGLMGIADTAGVGITF